MNLYFDLQYPRKLVEALSLLYSITGSGKVVIIHGDKRLEELDKQDTIVFLFDSAKRGISPITKRHYEAGFRVFVFMSRTAEKMNFFHFSIQMLFLWRKLVNLINTNQDPFIGKFYYSSSAIALD